MPRGKEMSRCKYCGNMVPLWFHVCYHCDEELDKEKEIKSDEEFEVEQKISKAYWKKRRHKCRRGKRE